MLGVEAVAVGAEAVERRDAQARGDGGVRAAARLPALERRPRPAAISWARTKSRSEALVFSMGGVVLSTVTLIRAPRRVGAASRRIFRTRSRSAAFQKRMSSSGPGAFGDDVGLLAAADEPDVDRVSRGPQPLEPGDLGGQLLDGVDAFLGLPPWADRPRRQPDDQAALALELEGAAGKGRLEAEDEGGPAGQLADELVGRGVAGLLGRVDEDGDPLAGLDVEAVEAPGGRRGAMTRPAFMSRTPGPKSWSPWM